MRQALVILLLILIYSVVLDAVLIVYFKRNLAEMSKVLAAKIANRKS